jgi:hypothetical protein
MNFSVSTFTCGTAAEAVDVIRQHEQQHGVQYVAVSREKIFGTNGM